MHWIYLIPLGTGLVCGYYTLRSSDEITSFTGTFTLICLLISLFLAPWELQLLILLLVIAAARYYWQQLEARAELSAQNAEKAPGLPSSFANNQGNIPKESPISSDFPKTTSPAPSHRIYRGVAYDVTDSSPDSLSALQDNQNEPQSPRYRGLPYETVGSPVPPLTQLENKPKQATRQKAILRYRGVIVNPAKSESSEEE